MRRALLTAVSLTLFSLAALAEIVPYEETLTHRENSIASVRLDINFLGLGPLQASYPTFGECVFVSTPPAEKYVRIDSVGPVDPECVMYSGAECDGESSGPLGQTVILPRKLSFFPQSFECGRR
ncbi:predicted protein [Aspergillus terreus NIH2624]|uniref:AA1-like domain-containing protein n=1 Tax=Aspergillus terreus (strain NIH 2624 / FGSC A1156) TaxID=341663 RepID=Q0CN29_ASPTN|nr:uncharacterized protein ATEG_04905 [Aspergillus terreus NIH2624]EAU35352.1 predicted protein [Aspergillus terreus NIH2624]